MSPSFRPPRKALRRPVPPAPLTPQPRALSRFHLAFVVAGLLLAMANHPRGRARDRTWRSDPRSPSPNCLPLHPLKPFGNRLRFQVLITPTGRLAIWVTVNNTGLCSVFGDKEMKYESRFRESFPIGCKTVLEYPQAGEALIDLDFFFF